MEVQAEQHLEPKVVVQGGVAKEVVAREVEVTVVVARVVEAAAMVEMEEAAEVTDGLAAH